MVELIMLIVIGIIIYLFVKYPLIGGVIAAISAAIGIKLYIDNKKEKINQAILENKKQHIRDREISNVKIPKEDVNRFEVGTILIQNKEVKGNETTTSYVKAELILYKNHKKESYEGPQFEIIIASKGITKNIFLKNRRIEYGVEEPNASGYDMYLIDELITINEIQKDILIRYIEQHNSAWADTEEVVEQKVTEILGNNEIVKLLRGFLKKTEQKVFFDKKLFLAIEYILNERGREGYYLFSKHNVRMKEINDIFNPISQEHINYASTYIERQYYPLCDIIARRIDDVDFLGITWRVLNSVACDFFSEVWENNYGKYFVELKGKRLEEAIDVYCNIDVIVADDVRSAGILTYYLLRKGYFEKDIFIDNIDIVHEIIRKLLSNKENREFEKNLLNEESYNQIDDIDMMSGHEFEKFVALLFSKMGYQANVTKGSGDQGIDVIAEKQGKKYGIQAKCYSKKVNNKAIQEVIAGIGHYGCDIGIVVANNYFTKSAMELADSNKIVLWDRDTLLRKINEIFN